MWFSSQGWVRSKPSGLPRRCQGPISCRHYLLPPRVQFSTTQATLQPNTHHLGKALGTGHCKPWPSRPRTRLVLPLRSQFWSSLQYQLFTTLRQGGFCGHWSTSVMAQALRAELHGEDPGGAGREGTCCVPAPHTSQACRLLPQRCQRPPPQRV